MRTIRIKKIIPLVSPISKHGDLNLLNVCLLKSLSTNLFKRQVGVSLSNILSNVEISSNLCFQWFQKKQFGLAHSIYAKKSLSIRKKFWNIFIISCIKKTYEKN